MGKSMKRGRRAILSSDDEVSEAEKSGKIDREESDSHESASENDEEDANSSASPPRAQISASESAANNVAAEEISEIVDDIMAISGEGAEQNGADADESSSGSASPAGNSRRSASPALSLAGIGIDRGTIVDEDFPVYFRRDVEKVSRFLRNLETQKCDLTEKTHKDKRDTLTVPPRHVRTLDGVGKCLQLIPETSMSKYTQPFEGFPWVFVSR